MDRKTLHNTIQTFALAATLFTFPFRPFIVNNLCLILLAANWLLEGNFRAKLAAVRHNRISLAYAGLFLLMFLSALFSENKKYAGFVLEQNLVVLILPLVLASSSISRKQVITAFYFFAAGCFIGMLICLAHALYRYRLDPQTHYFFYHDLSKSILGLHAVYYSLYISCCILFLLFELERTWSLTTRWRKAVIIGAILFAFGFVLLLSSKTIIIGLALLVNITFLIWIFRRNRRYTGAILIGVINLLLIVGIVKVDYIKNRFLDSLHNNIEFIKQDTYSELTVFTGVTMRLTFWKFTIELLNEHNAWLMGLTIGDAQDALSKKAAAKGLYAGNKERGWTDYTSYNAHNQFMQYLLMMGVVGVIYFTVLLVFIVVKAIRQRNLLLLFSMILFILFCFTESALAVNKGLIFFSIIPPLLLFERPSTPSA